MDFLRRRLLLLAAASPLATGALAQPEGRMHVVGYWGNWTAPGRPPPPDQPGAPQPRIPWFEEGLARRGFVAGKNLRVAYAFTGPDYAHEMSQQARELLAQRPEVIYFVAQGVVGKARSIRLLDKEVPLIFANVWEEQAQLAVGGNLRRPAGNMTGVAVKNEFPNKRLEIVRYLLPNARRVAVVLDARRSGPYEGVVAAGKRLGLEVVICDVAARDKADAPVEERIATFAATLDDMLKSRPDAFMSYADFGVHAASAFSDMELRHRIPYIAGGGPVRDGVASYGVDWNDHLRRLIEIVVQILGGKKPADIPVDITSRFIVKVDLKRAKKIGLQVPPEFLLRADEVVQ